MGIFIYLTFRIMFKIEDCYEISPNEVKALVDDGRRICMSPHIGNKWRADLFAALYGVDIANLEGNRTIKDRIDTPGLAIIDEKRYSIWQGKGGTMSPYIQIDQGKIEENELQWINRFGENVATIHQRSTAEALGEHADKLSILAEYLLFRKPEVVKYLHTLLKNGFQIFNRNVTVEGQLHQAEFDLGDADELIDQHLTLKRHQVDAVLEDFIANQEGPIMGNRTVVLLICINAVLDQIENGVIKPGCDQANVHTVSGPDMIKFMKQVDYEGDIAPMYAILAQNHPELPKALTLGVIPGAVLEPIQLPGEANHAEIVELCNLVANATEIRQKIRAGGPDRGEWIDQNKVISHQIRQARTALKDARNPRLTQYDIVNRGLTLELPESVMGLTFAEIQKVFGKLFNGENPEDYFYIY